MRPFFTATFSGGLKLRLKPMKNTENLLISRIESDDINTIADSWFEIDSYAQPRPFGGDNMPVKYEQIKKMVRHTMTLKNACLFKACISNEIVGTISGHVYERPTANLSTIGVIYSLWVKGDFRQQGIGKSLLKYIEHELNNKGAKALQVGWETSNSRAGEWWKKRGYLPYETIASKIIKQ